MGSAARKAGAADRPGSKQKAFGQRSAGLRAAMVGVSDSPVCGVRDHAVVVARSLGRLDFDIKTYWLEQRPRRALIPTVRAAIRWAGQLRRDLCRDRPDAVVLHYSVFAFGYRGIPVHVVPIVVALRRAGLPTVVILHEFAYPWRRHGAGGWCWAVSQRVVLPPLLMLSSAAVVTTDERGEWLRTRWWLPSRQVVVLPVPSNVPLVPALDPPSERIIGVFGYKSGEVDPRTVIDAVALVSRKVEGLRLQLIGAPGPDGEDARAWRLLADAAGVTLEFTGILEPRELSRCLSRAGLMVFTEGDGPTSRRTTLAASLLHGKAIVAGDGPDTWPALRESEAVCLVGLEAGEISTTVEWLLRDRQARAGYEARASTFYQSRMSEEIAADSLARLLCDVGQPRDADHTSPTSRACR
jgi:glycosyltransferase involved in cell wall biosynthesis